MKLPSQPVTLTVEQVAELNNKLSHMRHDVNNNLALMLAAVELIKHKPQALERMLGTLVEQPPKVTQSIAKFSTEFEKVFGIVRS
jgi:hypothetical protein